MKMRSVSKRLATWLTACAVGAGIALLFAPRSGRRTRQLIGRKAQQFMDEAKDQVAEKTEDLYLRGRDAAQDTARRLRRRWNMAA